MLWPPIKTGSHSDGVRFRDPSGAKTGGGMPQARRYILKDGYRLALCYSTLGSVSKTILDDAQTAVRKVKGEATLDVLDHRAQVSW